MLTGKTIILGVTGGIAAYTQNRNSVGKRHNLVELMCNYNN